MTQQKGLAIIAPGGRPLDDARLPIGLARLRARGFVVHDYYDPAAAFQRFGGTDANRLAQLNDAIADPDIQLILAMRGAYGMTRLLDRIDFDALAASGKIVSGFSDLTALHMGLMARTGAMSYAGPMFSGDFCGEVEDALTMASFFNCLAGPTHVIDERVSDNPVVTVEGPVWGGNLSMLVSLLGTPYFPEASLLDGGIVYIEDVNEHPYRIERMLLQLLQAGVLGRQQALIIGEVSAFRLSAADRGYDFDAMLAYLREHLPIPVLTGLRFGHSASRVTIPFGAAARLVSDADGFTLTMHGYPTLGEDGVLRRC